MDDRQEFRNQVRDALAHLYDTAHLECHPLVPQLIQADAPSRLTRAQLLRSLLKETVEEIRPQPEIPSHLPEWRSYLALHYRYVREMGLLQVEQELDLSRRQLQRELQKGLDALCAILWERRVTPGAPCPPPSGGEAQLLQQELERWDISRQVCGVQALVDDIRWTLGPTLQHLGVSLEIDLPASLAPVFVDPTLTRQALSRVVRLLAGSTPNGGAIHIAAEPHGQALDILLEGGPAGLDESEQDWTSACLLIGCQGSRLQQSPDAGGRPRVIMSLPQASRARILVVDDVEASHRLIERYLAPHNYEVIGATSGPQALCLAKDIAPDVVILDVMLPSMDGWQVLRELQSSPATAAIPVVVCSVLDEPQLALSLGARAFVKKPVDRLQLLNTLDAIRSARLP